MYMTSDDQILSDLDYETRNLTQLDHQHYGNHSSPVSEFEPFWLSLSLINIILFTVGGNSLVCIAVLRERNLQNTTNYFLTSLAFTDCLVACLVMPLAVAVELLGYFPFDALTCIVWSTFDVCCCTSSIWHMSVMSLDRYLTLRYPLRYGRNKRRSLMAYKIVSIWLISFAICLPLFILGLVDSSNVYDAKARACFPANRTFKIYGSFAAFLIPLTIMLVTYTLTMAALRQAHITKKTRYKRREKIHAVINLAAMAIRWKRAVNVVEIPDEKKTSGLAEQTNRGPDRHQSGGDGGGNVDREKPAFALWRAKHAQNRCTPTVSIDWHERREQQLQSLPEGSIEQSSLSSTQHLDPGSTQVLGAHSKRSNSCGPTLNLGDDQANQQRRASVNTLLQIRRDSAKISEDLANLSAQLTASMHESNPATRRLSLFVPSPSRNLERSAPTIDQLLAETTLHQPIFMFTPFLKISSKDRERSRSADVRLSSPTSNQKKATVTHHPIPDVLVTHDSIQNLSDSHPGPISHGFNPSPMNTTCQRIQDWLAVTRSSIVLSQHGQPPIQTRCQSTINITEQTPMLRSHRRASHTFVPLSNQKRDYSGLEDLYVTASTTSSTLQQPCLLVNDQVPSIQDFTRVHRASVCSITSSMLKARRLHANRRSTSSSIAASFQQSLRKLPFIRHERQSQGSFHMVSLDTDDTSSCSSSLTHQSGSGAYTTVGDRSSHPYGLRKKRQKHKNLAKHSASNERKAMRVLLIIFSIFVLLWTPFFLINLLSCFLVDINPFAISIATWLGFCSSCANPVIYTIFSRAFRRAFINILTCRKVVRPHRSLMFRPSGQSIVVPAKGRRLSLSKEPVDRR